MCGIVGYVGHRDASEIVIGGLQRLEYRGYDSAGISVRVADNFKTIRAVGAVAKLELALEQEPLSGTVGIGHTRWATHGEPAIRNAHPHTSNGDRLTLVHNGIIENYETLKTKLISEGYEFHSDTDTEVLVNWIDLFVAKNKSLVEGVRMALKEVVGAYALLITQVIAPASFCALISDKPPE